MAEDKTLKVRATGIRVAHREHDKKGTIYDLKGSNLVKVIWDTTDTWMMHVWIVEVGEWVGNGGNAGTWGHCQMEFGYDARNSSNV